MVGDVVLLPFPYTDAEESKTRPTVVLADVRQGRFADWIVCPITTSRRRHRRAISIGPADLVEGTLRQGSRALPDRLATMAQGRFGITIARLTDAKTAELLASVRSLF